MQVYCKKCRWSYDLPGATSPGAKLADTPCTHCKQTGVLTRYQKALRDGTLNPANLRASVRRMAAKAARTGKLPDGSPLAPHTLLEQMAGLEPGAREHDATAAELDAGGFSARFVKGGEVALALNDLRASAVMAITLQKKQTRAAVVQAKATKRELRRMAASTAALAEVARVGVDALGELRDAALQIYAGFNCVVALLVELRDAGKPRGAKMLRDYLEDAAPAVFRPEDSSDNAGRAMRQFMTAFPRPGSYAEKDGIRVTLLEVSPCERPHPHVPGASGGLFLELLATISTRDGEAKTETITLEQWREAVKTSPIVAWRVDASTPTAATIEADAIAHDAEPEQEPAFSLGRSLVADKPTAGAVLRMKGGDTWKVLRAEGDEIAVLISPALEGPTREVTVARRNWAVLCNEAESVSPAVVGEGEQKPAEPERDFTNAHTLNCGPAPKSAEGGEA